ncbi:MAG: hypothetical protein FD174_1414 [Geobacteraceae bacterium]|nr:MAG: hypothetical protein FD174_1414 [Geobacteraceae bacterium]
MIIDDNQRSDHDRAKILPGRSSAATLEEIMKKKISRIRNSATMLLLILSFGCSTVGDRYGYVTENLNGWEIGRCKDYGSTSYEFKCGESTYSVCPRLYYDTSWIGPVPVPYLFPSFLMEKEKAQALSGVKIRVYTTKGSENETKNLIPAIKSTDGKILPPNGCGKWESNNNIEYRYAECSYDILVWDLPSFTLDINGGSPTCVPPLLKFKRKTTKYYLPFPPPHTPIVLFGEGAE